MSDAVPAPISFTPRHPALVAVDSDGCVFDTMGPKQVRCFHPEIIRWWGLERIERELRETAEFVNLRSVWRGSNRFPALLKVFELLSRRPEARRAGVALPDLGPLRRFVESGGPLSLDALRVREALAEMVEAADLVVVTQTPEEAVEREWREAGLRPYARAILGPAQGTKGEMLAQAVRGRYATGRVLMIGDAPGDRRAAREAGAAFFPILPGHEPESWARLRAEAHPRFRDGRWTPEYEAGPVAEFEALLPETPPWGGDRPGR